MTTRNRELASIIDDSGNITAGGNLTVSGTTLTASSTVETHADPLIELNTGAGSNSNDLGFVFERGSTGDNACIIWDESNDAFAVGTTSATGTSTGNMSYTVGDFLAGKVTVDSVLINGTTIGHTSDTDLLTLADGLLTVAGEISVTTLDIGGTNVTSTAAELNILDGVNSTAAELNILDGVTATATEINLLDGDTSATGTTFAAADRVIVNDAGTMKQVALSDFETFFESEIDTFSTIDINGGSIDGATVGAASASTGAFTTLTASGTLAVTGVTTLSTHLVMGDDDEIRLGDSTDITLKHHNSGYGHLQNTGILYVDAEVLSFRTDNSSIGERLNINAAGLAAFSGAVTVGGTLGVTGAITGTLGTAAQTNITSLGTLTSLTVAGNLTQSDGDYLYTGGGNFDIKHNTASQNIVFSTTPSGGSATERMRVKHDGTVGIGTTAPDVLLEIAGAHTSSIGMLHLDSSDHAFISLDAASSSHDKGIYFQEAGTAQAIIDHDGSANQLRIHDGSNTHMVITDAGNVGIGTTTPTSYNSSGQQLVVVDSGNTGISLIGGSSSTSSVMFGDGTGGTAAYRGAIKYDHSTDDMIFWAAAAEKMRILDSGNVSIGGTADDNGVLSVIANKGSAGDLWTQVGPNNNMSLILQNTSTTDNTNAVLYFANDSGVTAAINARFVDHSDE